MKSILICYLLFLSTFSMAQSTQKYLGESLGVVSYTYRSYFQKDVAATLDTLLKHNLRIIEISNLFGQTPEAFRKLLDEKQIKCVSYGVSYNDLVNKTDEVAQAAKVLGALYVRVAWIPHENEFTLDDAKKACTDFNTAGKLLKEKYGLVFCYHNHGYEFRPYENGTLFDYMMANTKPEHVSIELDILWVQFPGADPVDLLKRYGNRIKLIHLKDLKKGVPGNFSGGTDVNNDVALGTGVIDIAGVVQAAKKAKVAYLFIEDESDYIATQVPKSLRFLKSLK